MTTIPRRKRRSRKQSAIDITTQREKRVCVLRKSGPIQACHIYPNFMVHLRPGENNAPKFWDLLYLFWRPEKIAKWRAEFYNDADGPQKATDSCRNIICFADDIHGMWRRGLFAMRPIGYNDEMTEVEVEFHWMACQGHRLRESVPITKTPTSLAGSTLQSTCKARLTGSGSIPLADTSE